MNVKNPCVVFTDYTGGSVLLISNAIPVEICLAICGICVLKERLCHVSVEARHTSAFCWLSTTSCCKTKKSPTLPTTHPAWNAGLRQSRGVFCLSAYVRRSIQRNKSLPAVAVSRPIPNKIPIAKQVKSGIIFCNSCKLFFFCIAHKHHHIKSSPAWYAL